MSGSDGIEDRPKLGVLGIGQPAVFHGCLSASRAPTSSRQSTRLWLVPELRASFLLRVTPGRICVHDRYHPRFGEGYRIHSDARPSRWWSWSSFSFCETSGPPPFPVSPYRFRSDRHVWSDVPLDYSIDNLSLLALAICTGFVVDDAIVVIENIARYLEAGDSPLEAAIEGSREIGFTVLSMSISLVAVFIPIL